MSCTSCLRRDSELSSRARTPPPAYCDFNRCEPARGCRGARSTGDWPRGPSPTPSNLAHARSAGVESEVDEWIHQWIVASRDQAH